ncbi:succinylglutamate desuccinylase/aspartoacylase family protein [candidate division KSB1 bacterium]|nr:succinylglutamate desuccinylase/aspartoacylase family protein [candidate division KSB1 bacterium]
MHQLEPLYPSQYLTEVKGLSEYFSAIRGSSGDTEVYIFDSGQPGTTVLLLGGTHPNESSSLIAAVITIENLRVTKGKLIVIPRACKSGFTCTDPMEGCPQMFTIATANGHRKFRFGSRVANPLDQWPDPLVYSHYPSGQKLSGFETRNLNRSYPGRSDGSFSEKVGYAIVQLIRIEKVDIAIDLHEAAPEIPIINAIISHEKCRELAATAILNLEFSDLKYAMEMSPYNFHGLSHREWGDNTETMPFLMETCNPIQGRLRGRTHAGLIIDGADACYARAVNTKALRITYNPAGQPLKERVGRHLQGIIAIMEAFNELYPDRSIVWENLPGYSELMENDVGSYLH